jgi:GMP synthase (glutamine-hydrolysing)
MKRILVVRAGSAPEQVRARHGDFTDWFEALLGGRASGVVVDAVKGELPDPRDYGGILVTGSLASVTRLERWMEALGAWLLGASEHRPVLGVCFGHQLLAHALGGRVERHPDGPELGTVEVELTSEGRTDPLFQGMASPLSVQVAHEDHVPEAPPGAVVLARNRHAPVQAFAAGPRLRGVQFHPEFDADRNRSFVEVERPSLDRRYPGVAEEALARIRPTPGCSAVLHHWLDTLVVDERPRKGGA